MMSFITLNHRDFSESMKRLGADLRVSARRINREIAENLVEEATNRISFHSKTGNMVDDIFQTSFNGWTRVVFFGDAQFLDSGSRPHKMPFSEAERMAPFYGLTAGQLFGKIKKDGTPAHSFIDDTYNTVLNRVDSIIERELDKIIK